MIVRLLRGLAGKALTCGCLAGTYETYDGAVVTMIDARGPRCVDPNHAKHARLRESPENPDRYERAGRDIDRQFLPR
jgi:hypothetical protein